MLNITGPADWDNDDSGGEIVSVSMIACVDICSKGWQNGHPETD